MGRLGSHAVYASSGGSPHQDARLASGCWPNSSGWTQWPTGFLRKVSSMLLTSLSSLPRLLLAQARVGLIDRSSERPLEEVTGLKAATVGLLVASNQENGITAE